MCAPALIPAFAAAAGAGGAYAAGAATAGVVAAGVMGAASGMQASSNIQAAEYNEELAKIQQDQLEGEAKNVRIAGSQEAGRQKIETEKLLAQGRAESGASGISGTTGTPGQLAEDVAEVGTLESMTILSNANRQAFGLETEGQNLVEKAKAEKKSANTAGYTTILTSAASGYLGGMGGIKTA